MDPEERAQRRPRNTDRRPAMSSEQILGIELRFWPEPDAGRWFAALKSVLRWEPRLRPALVDRLSDLDAAAAEPWSDALWPELADRCADERRSAWMLFSDDDDRFALTVRRLEDEVEFSITAAPTRPDPADDVLALVEELAASVPPALAMAFDRKSDDAKFILDGLRSLTDVPPLLYMDAGAVDSVGGIEHLTTAACEVRALADGGALFIRRSPWEAPSVEDDATARCLGIENGRPLVLLRSDQ